MLNRSLLQRTNIHKNSSNDNHNSHHKNFDFDHNHFRNDQKEHNNNNIYIILGPIIYLVILLFLFKKEK